MEAFRIVVCLSFVAWCVNAGVNPSLGNNDGDSEIQVALGAQSVEIIFKQAHVMGSLDNYVKGEIHHYDNSKSNQRLLGKFDKENKVSDLADGYQLSVVLSGDEKDDKIINVTIDKVSNEDDGFFECIVFTTDNGKNMTAERQLLIARKLDALHLKFDDNDFVSDKPENPIEEVAGTYPVTCVAEGSNPATDDIKVHLDGNVVAQTTDAKVEKMVTAWTQYKSTVMVNVTLPEKKAVNQLECVATDPYGNKMSTKLDISVLVPKSEDVQCEETKAKDGDESVSLVCTVNHAKLNVTKYAFQIGATGDIIEAGADAGENQTETVTVKELSSTKTEVTLTLSEAKEEHFAEKFYLVLYLADGHVRKDVLRLKDTGSAGNVVRASVSFTALLGGLAVLWARR